MTPENIRFHRGADSPQWRREADVPALPTAETRQMGASQAIYVDTSNRHQHNCLLDNKLHELCGLEPSNISTAARAPFFPWAPSRRDRTARAR